MDKNRGCGKFNTKPRGKPVQNGNYSNVDDSMEWLKNVKYETLFPRITSHRIRQFFYDAETLTNEEIVNVRQDLQDFRNDPQIGLDEGEQWEAFHVDYYYECALQQ